MKLLRFFLTLLPLCIYCQPYIDLVKVENHLSKRAMYDTGSFATPYREISADILVPIVLERVTLLTGANYEFTSIQDPQKRRINLSNTFFKVGFSRYTAPNISWTLLFLPRYSSSLKPGSARTLQFGFIGFRKIEKSKNQNFRWGLYANQELFGPLLVPLLGWYRNTGRWEMNFLLPLFAEMNYFISPNFKTGFRFSGIVKSYAFGDYGTTQYAVKSHNEISLIQYFTVSKLVAFISCGTTVGRNIRIYDQGDTLPLAISAIKVGDNRIQRSVDFDDSLFIRLGIYYRLPVNN